MQVKLNINGLNKTVDIKPHQYLVEVLRDMGYMGVKEGCETGNCGVCTIHVEGSPVLSCAYLAARAEGKKITTIEGLQEEAKAVGEFIVGEGVDQCGFCSPGLIMAVLGMEKELENPTEADIRHYLSNNLCRCTGYAGQLRAIKKYMGVE